MKPLKRASDFTLLVRFGVSTIFSGQVTGNARHQRMLPYLMAAGLMVQHEASTPQVSAQLAEFSRHRWLLLALCFMIRAELFCRQWQQWCDSPQANTMYVCLMCNVSRRM
jgi:hypothetical protein